MANLKKKILLGPLGLFLIFIFLALSNPSFKQTFPLLLKQPLYFFSLFRQECGALIFFHRNFVQNEKLKQEIGNLKRIVIAQQEIYSENARLNNLLQLKEKLGYKLVAARIIARPADNWSSSSVIDRGRRHGIKTGMAVLGRLGLIGRIIEASQYTAKILLLNDPNMGVSALVERSRQEGLVQGTLGPYLVMKYLSADADIIVNDTIVTSGLTTNYPKGLVIGKVIEVGRDLSGLSRYAVVRPISDISTLEEVLVVLQ